LTDWPAGLALARFDEIDSTNEEARRRAVSGETGPLWIMAARQTAGRGRRGRAWDTGAGNLAATLLLCPARARQEWPQLSFAAAIAAWDMCSHFAPKASITLKWPNDVLAGGGKLAGLLLEAAGSALAIGIGVNLACHPSDTPYPATSLMALGVVAPPPEDALAMLAARFAHWYDAWVTQGFSPLREAWLARAGGVGAPILARLAHEERTGVFEGIDAEGALLLNRQGRVETITAGEVFFR
jgi:BirA family biotin operon repressor/biotin-[acetyl-CoA-carboxylase] ligase